MNRRHFLQLAAVGLTGCATARPPAPRTLGAWDLHCHTQQVPGAMPEEQMKNMIEIADRVGIERMCVLALGPNEATPEEIRRANDACLRAIEAGAPRALGFVFLNPAHPEVSLRELDRCVRDGPMVGVKLHVARRCNGPELDPIIRRAAELKALVYQHTWLKAGGNPPGESTPYDLVELAGRHPGLPLVCGHAGGEWERGIRIIRPYPRLYLEIAGSDPTAGFVETAVRELGAERIVYGSDIGGRSFASQLGKVRGAQIPEGAKALILRENLRRLLRPILAAKGMPL